MSKDQIFLSYAHEDLYIVRKIFDGLTNRKLSIWFDKEHLGPGRWKSQIIKSIARSRFFIICISEHALRKTGDAPGFQDDELNTAYNIAQEQSDTEFTIVPIRLEDCGRGDFRIKGFQQYDLFDDFEKGLNKVAVNLGGISLSDAKAKDERTEDEKMIERLMGKAEAAVYAGDYGKAITIWDSVLAIKSEDAKTWTNKGVVLGILGRFEEALEAYDRAVTIDPEIALAWTNKGFALGNLGRWEEAIEACDRAVTIDPEIALAWYNKGFALGSIGRFEEALKDFDRAVTIDPEDATAWTGKGIVLWRLGRVEEALAACDKALEINPNFPEAWTLKKKSLSVRENEEKPS